MAKKEIRQKSATKVESIRHRDVRTNIPTEELRDFVAEDEAAPKTMLYPRDPTLDPQLVWKGKDEQDRNDLAVPVVPIYIQEKIHPQAIIQSLIQASSKPAVDQLDLFGDFNGIEDFDKKVDFYHHDQHWTNRLILGDSLLVMASLAEKEGLKSKVQTIYLDPPYGIEFKSNWQVSTRQRDVTDGKIEDVTRQPEQVCAFRDTWKLGIHTYLAYLRDRLVAAHTLLTDTGSIFVQINDANVHLVRAVLDEVFGAHHAVVTLVVKKKGSQNSSLIDPVNDYILWYSKTARSDNESGPKFRPLMVSWGLDSETLDEFRQFELPSGQVISVADAFSPTGEAIDYRTAPRLLLEHYPNARLFRANPLTSGGLRTNQSLPFEYRGKRFEPPNGGCWKHTAQRTKPDEPCGMERLAWAGRLLPAKSTWRFKSYLADYGYKPLSNWWDGLGGATDPIYVVQTNTEIAKRCILLTTDPGDLVLDPTCGSGTTAYVAEQWGRRWITIDTSRVALALARTRLMAARYPYYLLADSPEGVEKMAELTGTRPPTHQTGIDIRRGFVCHSVSHITSGHIANNPDITDGMTRQQIDDAIARHAERETLHDRPYEDSKRVRVTGPFSVESLSPHRVLSADEPQPSTITDGHRDSPKQFADIVLDNLRAAGVQNTRKSERLRFDRLDAYAGAWIHAAGEYSDAEGTVRRVAVSIGPEHGTVGPHQVKEAAKEAVKGVGFQLLVICGFAFDPHVPEEAKRYGALTVVIARMNPDIAMGDELLKKTGSGNLFMVFGEPDVDVLQQEDGTIIAELKGVDVYDPTTGQIRNSSTADIACWFLDTNYNGESFFVRHAYFTGADEPYKKLQKALRADINEDAWNALYSTRSRPFSRPSTGKLAIKVINHYGDEVLKILEA